ncbi:MAG: hypothetical protein KA257_05860 [Opitutaceae bacterium]|nr:hypothetical protein [Opitutaceae bacterium]MBP9911893.1 hypothetical protein [Opitutaceae bacterium]
MDLTTVSEVRSSALSLREHLEAILEMLTARMRDEAHPEGNMEWLQECAREAELLKGDLRSLSAIEDHMVSVLTDSLSFESDDVSVSPAGLRSFTIEISQGMINQNLLTLTDAKKRGLVRDGEKFRIELPDGTSFATELCDPGNKLRERGLIRKLYNDAKLAAGDKVVMAEMSRGVWKLRPQDETDLEKRRQGLEQLMSELDAQLEKAESEKAKTGNLPQNV